MLLTAVQTHCQLIATPIGVAGAGTFTNVANTFFFTINTQTSGTIAIGTKIYLGPVHGIRTIASYSSGTGGTGQYSVSTQLITAQTNVAYTNQLSYGWAVVSIT